MMWDKRPLWDEKVGLKLFVKNVTRLVRVLI